MEESPLLGVEVIEQGYDAGIIESFVAQPLADMGPVFLFDVGVIVLVIGSASGEVDGVGSVGKVSQEMIIEEFRSVIAIEPPQRERQGVLDMVELCKDAGFSLSPHCPLFASAGGDIHTVNGVGEHPAQRGATVCDGIGFEKTGAKFVSLVGCDGDVLF